jgi:large subunit ribosomal protein L9e
MKTIHASEDYQFPEKVTVNVKNRIVTVKGPKGTLKRDFSHLHFEMKVDAKSRTFTCGVWFGKRADRAAIKTVVSHVRNLCLGVTKGFRYKMRFAYAHFPVNVTITDDKVVEVRNFLGEKRVRRVQVVEGVTATRTDPSKVKDEIILEGNDIDVVSKVAANIHQSCLVKRKDIRKFLDGIYVSQKGPIEVDA